MAETRQPNGTVSAKHPSGAEILGFLVELLAEQEGVTITYRIETKEDAAA